MYNKHTKYYDGVIYILCFDVKGELKIERALQFDYSKVLQFITQTEINDLVPAVMNAHQYLHQNDPSNDEGLGWVDIPIHYDRYEFQKIKDTAMRIQSQCDVLLVIGIGGSYLGAKAVMDLLNHSFYNALPKEKRTTPEIYFIGNSLSPVYLSHLLDVIEGKEICINVISKSGNTIEPAIAFRFFRQYMIRKYGKEKARDRIYVTTDKQHGALKRLAIVEGYDTFVIPENIGGRYSVLTAVGLLPIAVSGIDIDSLMLGAAEARTHYMDTVIEENDCYLYAVIRNVLYRKGKAIEMLVAYEPQFRYFAEWWKQLFGESEGKNGKGIFPAVGEFTTDLHSMGQYIQEGTRNVFETVVTVEKPTLDIKLEFDEHDGDGLNYLAGSGMDYINKQACIGTMQAHSEGGVPNLHIIVPELNAFHVGELIYFFEKSCAMSGLILGVNPFDQPGVEAYKRKMYTLLERNENDRRG